MNDSGPDGFPPPESFSRCDRSVERSVPVPEPNLKSMASLRASSMMSSMLSFTLWIKQAEPWGNSYGFSGCADLVRRPVPVPVAERSADAVLVEQADVEPDGRVERSVLVQAKIGKLAVEVLAVLGRGKIAVLDAPVGEGARHPMDQLADAGLALAGC